MKEIQLFSKEKVIFFVFFFINSLLLKMYTEPNQNIVNTGSCPGYEVLGASNCDLGCKMNEVN